MQKGLIITEVFFSAIDSYRAANLADECLVELRVIESRREADAWIQEYEVRGEVGKVEKFLVRLKSIDNPE